MRLRDADGVHWCQTVRLGTDDLAQNDLSTAGVCITSCLTIPLRRAGQVTVTTTPVLAVLFLATLSLPAVALGGPVSQNPPGRWLDTPSSNFLKRV